MVTTFKVGDIVEIIDNGKTYTTYDEWVKLNAPIYVKRYEKRGTRNNGTKGKIVALGMHINEDKMLFLLEIADGQITLISERGIKLIEEDKKMKLKLELFRYESVVFGKVLEQSEDLRGMASIKHNGFRLSSVSTPELFYDGLFIRGEEKESDEQAFSRQYTTNEEAIKVVENIKILVDKVNEVENEVTSNGKIIQIL